MANFFVKSDELLNHTLALQKINDIALPLAVQNTLNTIAKDVKTKSLLEFTNKYFDVKRKGFFKANSGYKFFKAKQAGYNINRIKSEVGIVKGRNPKDKATEQVGLQQTATPIKRSINPLGNKPLTKSNVDILRAKPIVYDSSIDYAEGNSVAYIRRAQKAYRNNRGFLVKGKSGKGAVNRVKSIRSRKPTKSNPRRMEVNTKAIASYVPSGRIDLNKKRPFLNDAVNASMSRLLQKEFNKEAQKQFERAMKRK